MTWKKEKLKLVELACKNVQARDLYGCKCPECKEEIDAGSLRFNGIYWQHMSSETIPQAGHHVFDVRETDAYVQ